MAAMCSMRCMLALALATTASSFALRSRLQRHHPSLRAVAQDDAAAATALSDDFDGAVADAAGALLAAIDDGAAKLRLDFDTRGGRADARSSRHKPSRSTLASARRAGRWATRRTRA